VCEGGREGGRERGGRGREGRLTCLLVLRGVLKAHPSRRLVGTGRELGAGVDDDELLSATTVNSHVAGLDLGRREGGREGGWVGRRGQFECRH